MIKLGIIEDNEMVRRSLANFFNGTAGFSCLLEAGSVEAFFELWKEDIFLDMVLSDIGLPGVSGIEGVKRIRKKHPQCQVMMLTIYEDTQSIFQALCAGAAGYVSKQTSLSKIKEALQTIYDGGGYMSPGIARKITEYYSPSRSSSYFDLLTPKEEQVLHAVEEGLSNQEIADRLGTALETVKSHVKKIYQKLEVSNRMDIVKGRYR